MSDIAYRLLVDMSAKGSLVPQLGQMEQRAKGLDTTFKGFGSSLTSGVGSAISGVASAVEQVAEKMAALAVAGAAVGVAGLGVAVKHGIALNDQIEKTQIGLAAIFNAQGVSPNMAEGMNVATAVMEKMRIHARDLPGELKDLQQIFKLGLTPGLQLGASVGQLERMSANAMAAAATMQLPMDQAARELAQLYAGHAGGHNVFGQQLGFQGEAAKKLNTATSDDRLKQIEEALKKYQSSIPYYAKTFEALTSTLRDTGEQTLRRATRPLFDGVKAQLDRANTWLGEHEQQVGAVADRVGQRLLKGFDIGRAKVEQWTPAVLTFAGHAEEAFERIWQRAKPILGGLERVLLLAAKDPDLFRHLETGAKAYVGIKATRFAMPALSGLADMGGAALGLEGVAASVAGVGVAAAVAIPALAIVGSTFHVLTDTTSAYHQQATQSAAKIAENATKSLDHVEKTWDRLGPQLMKPVDFLATQYLAQFEVMSDAAAGALTSLDRFTEGLQRIGVIATKELPTPSQVTPFEYQPSVKAMGDILQNLDIDALKTKKVTPPTPHVHIGRVEIVVTSNQDPSRIARLTRDRLLEVPRRATTSAATRNWSSERP